MAKKKVARLRAPKTIYCVISSYNGKTYATTVNPPQLPGYHGKKLAIYELKGYAKVKVNVQVGS